jgi:hypothetical protein
MEHYRRALPLLVEAVRSAVELSVVSRDFRHD